MSVLNMLTDNNNRKVVIEVAKHILFKIPDSSFAVRSECAQTFWKNSDAHCHSADITCIVIFHFIKFSEKYMKS
jgi:hypothetical protein